MDRYLLEYIKAKQMLKQASFLNKTYWRRRVVFLHKILKEQTYYKKLHKVA